MKDKLQISTVMLRYLKISSWAGIIIVMIISLLDIIGWIFDFQILKAFGLKLYPMQEITALCFLLCSTALILFMLEMKGKFINVIKYFAGFSLSMSGLLTIISYMGVLNSGKELSLTTAPFLEYFLSSGTRMAFISACNFFIIGASLILLTRRTSLTVSLANILMMLPLVMSYFVVLSYFLDIHHLTEIENIPVALNTGIAFLLFCIAFLFYKPDSVIMKSFTGNYAGNIMARRLLPGLIIIPIVIGWLRIQGEVAGLYPSDVGVALVALTYTLCFLGLVLLTAKSVNSSDKERARNGILLSEAQRIANIGSWEWNIKTGEAYWSDQMYRIFGEEKGKFVPSYEGFIRRIHPDDRKLVEDVIGEAINKVTSYSVEFRVIPEGQPERTVFARADLFIDEVTDQKSFVGASLDITDMKKAEEKIRESEERFRLALKNAPVSIAGQDLDLRFIWNYNQRTVKDSSEVLGKTDWELFPEDAEKLVAIKRQVIETGQEFRQTMWISRPGRRMYLDIYFEPIRDKAGKIAGVEVATVDLTDLKLAELALQENEQRLKFHFENSPLAVVEWDANYIVTQWSSEAERLFGWSREETIGKPIADLNIIYKEDIQVVENTMVKLSSGKDQTVVSTNRNITKSGNVIECTWFNSVLVDEKGEMNSVMSLVMDITERKKSEKAVHDSQERLRSVLDNSTDAIYRLNLQTGRYEYISPSVESVLDITSDELMKLSEKESMARIHPDDLPAVREVLAKLEKSGKENLEYRFRTRNGAYRWISNHMSMIKDKEGTPLYRDGNVRDISDIKRSEEEILAVNEELTLFNKMMVGRELRMIELKREINGLCSRLKLPPVYEVENEEVNS
jgi:PAS domain S-box-containing protein